MRGDLIKSLDVLYSSVEGGTIVNQVVDNFSESIRSVLGNYCILKVKTTSFNAIIIEDKP